MPDLARVSARRAAGGPLWLATLEVTPGQAAAYVAAGQYVKVKTPAGNGYFALASEPGKSPFELLVRNNGDASAVLTTEPLPFEVELEGPLGAGFPFARAAGRQLIVAVVGSAIAVARPLLRSRIASGEGGRTHLFVGARAPSDVPLRDEVEAWSEQAHVTLCLSRAEVAHELDVLPRARRRAGYVQAALAALGSDAVVFAAGPAAMLSDIRALGAERGADRHPAPLDVFTNA
jgi:NAD(P)H-flavin reductase